MKIAELRMNHIVEPMGYQYAPVSFSWKVDTVPFGAEAEIDLLDRQIKWYN